MASKLPTPTSGKSTYSAMAPPSHRFGYHLFRALGLQLITALSFARAPQEPPKVAIQRSRSIAATRLLVHVIPVLAAVALIILNFKGLLVNHTRWYSVLQYVAKFHEILMQASIATVFMMYLRRLMILDHPTPFGAYFAGLSITHIGYLWSPEFWGALTATWTVPKRRFFFLISVIFSVLLAASVGPSSAILMIPRPTQLSVSTHRTAIDTGVLFPPRLENGSERFTNQQFITSFIESGAQIYRIPYDSYDMNWSVDVYHYEHDLSDRDLQPNDTSTAYVTYSHIATPMRIFADLFDEALSDTDASSIDSTGLPFVTMESQMPSVATMCSAGQRITGSRNSSFVDVYSVTETSFDTEIYFTEGQLLDAIAANNTGPVIWMPVDYWRDRTTLSGMAVYITNDTFPGQPEAGFTPFTCVIKASWPRAVINATLAGNYPLIAVFKDHPLPKDSPFVLEEIYNTLNPFLWQENPIALGTEWVKNLRVRNNNTNSTYDFASMDAALQLEALSLDDTEILSSYVSGFSITLAALIANALSTSYCESGCARPALGPNSTLSTGTAVQADIRMRLGGMGYTARSWPSGIAIGILMLYCLVILGSVVWSLLFGISASAWDSAAEITALALHSEPPSNLGHISAGLDTLDVFRRPVGVMARSGELEFVFETGGQHGFDDVKENEIY